MTVLWEQPPFFAVMYPVPRVVLSLTAVVLLASCTIKIGAPSATPEPSLLLPPVPGVSEAFRTQVGPLVVMGLQCFTESSQGPRYATLAFYNPTDQPLVARVPAGRIQVRAGEATGTDRLQLNGKGECIYQVRLGRSDPENARLVADYDVMVKGAVSAAPQEESRQVLARYFEDLKNRDVDALRRYVDPRVTVNRLAERMAWRTTVEPVQSVVERCSPRFEFDQFGHGGFSLVAWQCPVSVVLSVFSPQPGSDNWKGTITQDLAASRWVLIEDRAY